MASPALAAAPVRLEVGAMWSPFGCGGLLGHPSFGVGEGASDASGAPGPAATVTATGGAGVYASGYT